MRAIRIAALTIVVGTMAVAVSIAQKPRAGLMGWGDLLGRTRPTGQIRIPYGPDPLQVGDLWLPKQAGRRPVVLMIHGGCWQSDIADRSIMDWIAADLAGQGIAVWNIDYRGVDRPGGGYPGTFLDVAAAADHLGQIAPTYQLDTRRVVAIGHSAGGHLALWLAGRPKLPRGSALKNGRPTRIVAVVASGSLPDLEAAQQLPGNDCGRTGVPRLVGEPSGKRSDVFADTSASRLLPLGVRQILVNASQDRIAPPSLAARYIEQARKVGEKVDYVEIPGAGHVELIAPDTAAWVRQVALIRTALGMRPAK